MERVRNLKDIKRDTEKEREQVVYKTITFSFQPFKFFQKRKVHAICDNFFFLRKYLDYSNSGYDSGYGGKLE